MDPALRGSRRTAVRPADRSGRPPGQRQRPASLHAGDSGSSSAVSSSATALRTSRTSAPRSSRSTACAQGQVRCTSMPGRRWASRRPRRWRNASSLLVILGAGVPAFAQPGPQVLPDVVVVVRADLSEVLSRPAADVLGDLEVTVQAEPLGGGGVPEGEVHVGPGLPGPGVLCHEVEEPLSPAGPVQGLGLRLQFCWPGDEHEAVSSLLKRDPLR